MGMMERQEMKNREHRRGYDGINGAKQAVQ